MDFFSEIFVLRMLIVSARHALYVKIVLVKKLVEMGFMDLSL